MPKAGGVVPLGPLLGPLADGYVLDLGCPLSDGYHWPRQSAVRRPDGKHLLLHPYPKTTKGPEGKIHRHYNFVRLGDLKVSYARLVKLARDGPRTARISSLLTTTSGKKLSAI